jgi:capsular polysaccharide biosynthesis protein/Mrp family chromosome partitioning ATPase
MESAGYLRIFRERWVVILLTTIVGIAVAFGAAQSITKTYRADATLFMQVTSPGASLYERSQFSLARVKSYPDLVNSPDLLRTVIDDLGLDVTPAELRKHVSAENPINTVFVVVSADSSSPVGAADLANSAAKALSSTVDKLENKASTDSTVVVSNVQLVLSGKALTPSSPSSPNVPIIVGLGFLAGLTIGLIAAIVLERTRPRVRTAADVRRIAGLPLIAQLPPALSRKWMFGDGVAPDGVQTSVRNAASNLRAISRGQLPPVIALVPVGSRPARASSRIGIARGLANTGRMVVLIESDINAQKVSRLPVVDETPGLAEVLGGSLDVPRAVIPVKNESFQLLPAGSPFAVPTEFAAEQNIGPVVAELAKTFDVAVVQVQANSRPLSLPAIAPVVRGAVLVTSFSQTTARQLRRELSLLRILNLVPIGVIMTDVPSWRQVSLLETWQAQDFVTTTIEHAAPVAVSAPAAASAAEPAPEKARQAPRASATRTPRAKTNVTANNSARTATSSSAPIKTSTDDDDESVELFDVEETIERTSESR